MTAPGARPVASSLIAAAVAAPAKNVPAAMPADNDQQNLIHDWVNRALGRDQAKLVTACDDKVLVVPASSRDDNNPISRVVNPAAPGLDLPAKAGKADASADHPATDVAAGGPHIRCRP
jgi:hypothetical protein